MNTETITETLNYIQHHKQELVAELFEGSTPDYQREWLKRDVGAFWSHLDLGNREHTVSIARAFYAQFKLA